MFAPTHPPPPDLEAKTPQPDPKPDVDAILNRAAVALARSQKLVDSWLPLSRAGSKLSGHNSTKESPRVDEPELIGRPERLGLGATVPTVAAGDLRGRGSAVGSELDKLRRQMLGRKAGRAGLGGVRNGVAQGQKVWFGAVGGWGDGRGRKREESDGEDDDEESRAGLFRSKKVKGDEPKVVGTVLGTRQDRGLREDKDGEMKGRDDSQGDADCEGHEDAGEGQSQPGPMDVGTLASNRPASYLDQVLAERSEKKQKKKKEKSKNRGNIPPSSAAT